MTRMLSANSGALFLPADVSIKLAIAIGIGLLVGLEREWSHKELGARTFTIVSMDGALSVLAGNAIVFLASPESGWITAQMLTVDGGRMDYIGHG